MLKIFRTPINVKTPDGYKIAYGMRKLKKEALRIHFGEKYIDASMNHRFIEDSKIIYSKDVYVGLKLSNYEITKIENIGEIDVYDLTDVDGNIYYTNDILSHNCEFLGSSSTLISTEALKIMTPMKPIKKDNIFNGVKIYKEPKPKHNYILSVDPSKDGIDSFAVQVTDITTFPFVQVASAKLDVDYLIMPEHLDLLGRYYNEAFVVIENNEGAGQSVADTLFMTYEYPNMYRDRDTQDKKYKKFYGFRTTKSTRPLILNMMKIFIEEGKYIVNDEATISEFFNFIKSDNLSVKFEAEEGYHDDMVMALAIMFAPFMHNKAFDDHQLFLSSLRIDLTDTGDDVDVNDFYSMLDTSGMDDGTDDSYSAAEALAAVRGGDFGTPDQFMDAMNTLRV